MINRDPTRIPTRPVNATRRIDSGPLGQSPGHRVQMTDDGQPKPITRPLPEAPVQSTSASHPLAAYWQDKARQQQIWTQLVTRGETDLIPLNIALGLATKARCPWEMVAPFHGAVLAGDHRMGTYCARLGEQCWEGNMAEVYQALVTALPDALTTFWKLRLIAWVPGLIDFCNTRETHGY